jgi:hypothetical protein
MPAWGETFSRLRGFTSSLSIPAGARRAAAVRREKLAAILQAQSPKALHAFAGNEAAQDRARPHEASSPSGSIGLPAGRSRDAQIQNLRAAGCVGGGFRYGEGSDEVGSLLLGLYDDRGKLDHVGVTPGIHATERALRRMEPLKRRLASASSSKSARPVS